MSRTVSFVNRVGTFKEVVAIIRQLKLYTNQEEEISVELPLFIKVTKKRSIDMQKTADILLNNPAGSDPDWSEYDEASLLYGRLVNVHENAFCLGIYPERVYALIRLGQIKVMYLLDEDRQYLINGFVRTKRGEDRISIENAYAISYKSLYNREKIKMVDYQMPNQVDHKQSIVLADQVVPEEEVIPMIFEENIVPLVIEVDAKSFDAMEERRSIILANQLDVLNHFQEMSVLYSKEIQRYKNKCYVALSLKYLQRMLERRKKAIFYMVHEGRECFIQDMKVSDEFNHQKIMLYDEEPVTMRSLCESATYSYLAKHLGSLSKPFLARSNLKNQQSLYL